MHRVVSCIIAVGLLLAPSVVGAQAGGARKEQSFQLKKQDAAVGQADTVDLQVQLQVAFALRAPESEPQPVEVVSSNSSRYTTTVLAARKRIVDRVKVVYGDVFEETVGSDTRERKVSPVSGRTYLAEMTKGRLVVTDEAGKPVSPEEQATVKDHLPELGKVDPLEAALPDKPIRVGDSLDRFAKVLTKEVFQTGDPSTRFSDTRVRLYEVVQGARGPVGVFNVSTTMTLQEAGSPVVMTIPLKGTLSLLGEGAHVLEFFLSGRVGVEVTGKLRKQGATVEGDGELKLLLKSSVSKP